jgi:endonuclease III
MVAASRAKSSDRAAIVKKLLPAIKKQYKVVVPKHDRPVLETMLYAICLEDASVDEAELAFERLGKEFPDLNEIRVSSISEIERAFSGLSRAEWRAFHVRSVLQYVFEKSFAFEFESLRKKTLELAQKQLAKIKQLSSFVRNYTLQSVIGAHQIPLDESMSRALIWLGLVPPNQDSEQMFRCSASRFVVWPRTNWSEISSILLNIQPPARVTTGPR